MKKISSPFSARLLKGAFLATCALFIQSAGYGQFVTTGTAPTNTVYTSGKVGIGTSTPGRKFQVVDGSNMKTALGINDAGEPALFLSRWGGSGATYQTAVLSNEWNGVGYGLAIGMTGWHQDNVLNSTTTKMYIAQNGNVGIGTTTASSGLEVQSANGGIHISDYGATNFLQVGGKNIVSGKGFVFQSTTNQTASKQFSLFVTNGTNQQERLTILNNGKVGIGTTLSTVSASDPYKLYVTGGIRTEQVKVDIASANNWADYVFKANYCLRPLSEVENFIKANSHLPEVPSADQVVKEGINLGEMDATLLKKIEELTLYMIEQNKRLNKLEQENMELKRENSLQSQKLTTQNSILEAQTKRLNELEKGTK